MPGYGKRVRFLHLIEDFVKAYQHALRIEHRDRSDGKRVPDL
jgi:hypothetical protein